MGVYIELPKEWAKWSFDVRDIHDNILEAKVTDLDLVRCWECRHLNENYDDAGNPYWICVEWDASTDYDGYCYYGERRTDE